MVSSSEQIWRNLALHNLLTSGSSAVNGCHQNESKHLIECQNNSQVIHTTPIHQLMTFEVKNCVFLINKSIKTSLTPQFWMNYLFKGLYCRRLLNTWKICIYIYIYIYIINTVLLYREEKRREEKRREEKRREEKRREEKRREEKRREVMQHGRLRLLLCPCMQKCDLQSHHGMLAT